VRQRIVIVYNDPTLSYCRGKVEEKSVLDIINSVKAVHESLLELGYEVTLFPLVPPFAEARERLEALNAEIVFNLFEGFCDHPEAEAMVAAAFGELGIIYTGCRPNALKLGLDKAKVKEILQEAGFTTPDFQLLSPATLDTFNLDFPCIVKPRADDASSWITADSLVDNISSLEKQVRLISKAYRGSALVERFIDGREFNATAMGNTQIEVLPASEITYSLSPDTPQILTYDAKWETESLYYKGTQAVCPAKINPQERRKIADTVMSVFKLIVYSGYARVDMRVDKDGNLNVIEVNPNPDISPDAGAALQAQAAGMNYTEFIGRIVNLALERDKYATDDSPYVKQGQGAITVNTK
jgi:D-alanine-D-alanine ligase